MRRSLLVATLSFVAGCVLFYHVADEVRYYSQMTKLFYSGKTNSSSEQLAGQAVISGAAWEQLISALTEAGRFIQSSGIAKSEQDYVDGYHYLINVLTSSLAMYYHYADPEYPYIGVAQDDTKRWAGDNTDALYLKSSLSPEGTYRLWGKRNTVRYLGLQVTGGAFGADGMHVVSNMSGEDLITDEAGNFELILSKTPHEGNWLELNEHADMLGIRQFFYDWTNETAAELHIERIDKTASPPKISARELSRRLRETSLFVGGAPRNIQTIFDREIYSLTPNTVSTFKNQTKYLGSKDQLYASGNWHLAEDEALIIEMKSPKGLYWNIQLNNSWHHSMDYQHRQVSLNGHQATVDDDGMLRLVIAHQDTGVANWLDTEGLKKGSFSLRLNTVTDYSEASTRVIPLSELKEHLPVSTRYLTQKERAEILRQRKLGIERRFNPTS